MTNRTVEIKGYGFGPTTATITVALEGTTVYTGEVTTTDIPVPSLPNLELDSETVRLCAFEIPVDFSGEKAMTCSVTNGTVIFAQIDANYVPIKNPVFTEADYSYIIATDPQHSFANRLAVYEKYVTSPFSSAEITTLQSTDPAVANEQMAILDSHGVGFTISGGPTIFSNINTHEDPRANVVINGIEQPATTGSGISWWKISAGSTLAYNLVVDAGVE